MSLNRSQLETEVANNYPDNTTGQITPAILRSTTDDILNNSVLPQDLVAGTNITLSTTVVSGATQFTVIAGTPRDVVFGLVGSYVSGTYVTNPVLMTHAGSFVGINIISQSPAPSNITFTVLDNGSAIQGSPIVLASGATFANSTSFSIPTFNIGDVLSLNVSGNGTNTSVDLQIFEN